MWGVDAQQILLGVETKLLRRIEGCFVLKEFPPISHNAPTLRRVCFVSSSQNTGGLPMKTRSICEEIHTMGYRWVKQIITYTLLHISPGFVEFGKIYDLKIKHIHYC